VWGRIFSPVAEKFGQQLVVTLPRRTVLAAIFILIRQALLKECEISAVVSFLMSKIWSFKGMLSNQYSFCSFKTDF
jgi:ABC-type uncharacterized transport system permease subunit